MPRPTFAAAVRAASLSLSCSLALLAGCSGHPTLPVPAEAEATPRRAAPVPSASIAPTAPVASARTVAASSTAALPPALAHFFAGFRDGSDFEFMRADCRAKMDRFVTLENVDVAAAIRSAKAFFHEKHELRYQPDLEHAHVEPHAGGTTVRVPVTMSWTYPIPQEWSAHWEQWGKDGPEVSRSVTVQVEVELDAEGKIARYVEKSVESPLLRVNGEAFCENVDTVDATLPWVDVKKGMLVQDLGETLVLIWRPRGPTTARKVRANGKEGWTIDCTYFPVDNPFGGTSAGGGACLDPVGDPGKP